ncbi:zinc-binding dehydrogenase [Colwellia sp. UCD-KL20]|uniref:zinc-binding dehydrogenase n=1 Tax=Colwellia sp. UCD-KL20 TaxID=1917165 RepID=UPI0009704D70|nr:zinc-binding dehydrogenase [Colwellia sp. UCD-KL20]
MSIIPKSFKAAVLVETQKTLVLQQIKTPMLATGKILVKMEFSGLCHSQLMEVKGGRGEDKFLPHLLGHEGVGEVVAIGEGVSKVAVGQRVVLGWLKGEGLESGGQTYLNESNTTINSGPVTTFSDYTVVSENRVVLCPKGLPSNVAVLLGCALPTGAGIILNQLQPKPNSSVVIFGLGGIGLSALLALNHFNVKQVIAFDVEEHKLALAKELGATHTYLANEVGLVNFFSNFPEGVDYAVEAAGKNHTIEMAFSLIKRGGGKCIFASHPKNGDKIKLDPFELICGKQIQGSWGGASKPDQDIPIIVDIINKYQIPVEKLLSNEYSLEQINTALDDLAARKIIRALIKLN